MFVMLLSDFGVLVWIAGCGSAAIATAAAIVATTATTAATRSRGRRRGLVGALTYEPPRARRSNAWTHDRRPHLEGEASHPTGRDHPACGLPSTVQTPRLPPTPSSAVLAPQPAPGTHRGVGAGTNGAMQEPGVSDAASSTGPGRLRSLIDAGIALNSELSLDALLQRLVEIAAELAEARYAALGVVDPAGHSLERFLTTGIDRQTSEAIGDLPH